MAKWESRWDDQNNQEVGLEAAILERVRNSSLVEGFCAENVTGLKPAAEAVDVRVQRGRLYSQRWSQRGNPPSRVTPASVGAIRRWRNPAAKPAGKGLEPLDNAWAW